jgi:outer membrane protein TolC
MPVTSATATRKAKPVPVPGARITSRSATTALSRSTGESEIASDRRALIQAAAVRRQSEIALNRLLHRPLEEPLATVDAATDDPELLIGRGATRYVDRPATFTVYRDFMVERGLARSPDLRALDAAVDAQQRILVAARRAFWLPDLALQGEYADRLAEDGAGGDGLDVADLADVRLPQRDDQDWTVTLQATLPLFTSGARVAEMRRASEELTRVRTVRRATAERVEEGIRSALLRAQSSFAAIRLSREAAAAAGKNLALVTDAYSRGVVGIITLLDAQNAAFVADQAAATAVFTFLADWMQVQRTVSEFSFLLSDVERAAALEELDAYFVAAGVPLGR